MTHTFESSFVGTGGSVIERWMRNRKDASPSEREWQVRAWEFAHEKAVAIGDTRLAREFAYALQFEAFVPRAEAIVRLIEAEWLRPQEGA